MNRIIALLLTISFLPISSNESSGSKFEYKEWHKSPTRSHSYDRRTEAGINPTTFDSYLCDED